MAERYPYVLRTILVSSGVGIAVYFAMNKYQQKANPRTEVNENNSQNTQGNKDAKTSEPPKTSSTKPSQTAQIFEQEGTIKRRFP